MKRSRLSSLGPSEEFLDGQRITLLVLSALILCLVGAACKVIAPVEEVPKPPGQPSSGPGGADYSHSSVRISSFGSFENQYWVFEPASPTPDSAPVIVMNHGFWGMTPFYYGSWIEHIVKKGYIVIYPRYQTLQTAPTEATQNAINAVKDAIFQLSSGGHVTPEIDKFAIVGHSFGGGITCNMTILAASEGLPKPKAIMIVQSGSGEQVNWGALREDLYLIPATTLMLVIIGSEDEIAGDYTHRKMFYGASQVPPENKDHITLFSDYHGEPPLIADHNAPCSNDERYDLIQYGIIGELLRPRVEEIIARRVFEETGAIVELGGDNVTDALEYYCFWKLFDGLTDAAFYGKNREYALGDTPEQRFMGLWSDGTPVKELKITDTP